ncbi:ATP-binding cassette domain-containing protein, partial [Bacillus vallismortis]|nr:ATP-binding cassette domain-containing protein [Bacillus vallismortis]
EDIVFRYRKDAEGRALDGVSLQVYECEWLAIVGHNGSGKSTLARALNGLIRPESGDIEVAGIQLTEESFWEVRKKIGMVFQNPDNQFVGTTVLDDVAFGLENNGVP